MSSTYAQQLADLFLTILVRNLDVSPDRRDRGNLQRRPPRHQQLHKLAVTNSVGWAHRFREPLDNMSPVEVLQMQARKTKHNKLT